MRKRPAHSVVGASGMGRWKNCPGSVVLIENGFNHPKHGSLYIVEEPQSEWAEEGTIFHAYCESLITGGVEPDGVTDEMRDHGKTYVEYVAKLKAHGYEIWIELPVEISSATNELYGTADLVAYNAEHKHLVVIDIKYGAGVLVEVGTIEEPNDQFCYYALGARYAIDKPIAHVSLGVFQPRIDHPDGPFRALDMSTEKLQDWGQKVLEPAYNRVHQARKRYSEFADVGVSEGDWCRFCPAFSICPRKIGTVETVMSEMSDDPKEDGNIWLAYVVKNSEDVRRYLTACNKQALARVHSGQTIPGQKMVKTYGHKRWKNGSADVLGAILGDAAYADRQLLSPAAFKRKFGDMPGYTDDMIEIPETGNKLVPVDDERPEVTGAEKFEGVVAIQAKAS